MENRGPEDADLSTNIATSDMALACSGTAVQLQDFQVSCTWT